MNIYPNRNQDLKNLKSASDEIKSVKIIKRKAISPNLSINFSIGLTPKLPLKNKYPNRNQYLKNLKSQIYKLNYEII